MRRVAVSAGLFLAACVGLGVVPVAASAESPTLVVAPARAVLPATPDVSGSCPAVDTPDGAVFPTETVLSLTGSGSGPWKVPLDAGRFTGFVVGLPADTASGAYAFTTECGGAAPFNVLAAPTVRLDPSGTSAGSTTMATGSCPRRPRGATPAPDVNLDGRPLGTAPFDAATGEFGPAAVPVPKGTDLGPHEVTTSCGGRATVTVLAPAAAPVSPGATLIVVPDLRGRTGTEAAAAVAGRLVLVGAAGGPGRVRSQDPAPGTRVRPGSAVAVVLDAAVQPGSTTTPLPVRGVLVAVLLLLVAALAAALVSARRLRLRRARRWLDEHVAVRPGGTSPEVSDGPREQVPGLSVQLVVHRDEAPQFSEEEEAHAGS